jgi:hypothetical protein
MRVNVARFALAAASVVMLTAMSWPTQVPSPANVPVRAYELVDQRNPKWFKSGFESLMVTNCAYGSMRIGDKDINPHFVVLLDSALGERFGNNLAGRVVTLHGFSVHLNNSLGLREGVRTMYGPGLADKLLNKKKVGCEPEDLLGGYTVGEVQPGMPPVVVAIDLDIDGQHFFARAVTESPKPYPPRKKAPQAEKDQWNAAVASALEAALANLCNQVEQGTSARSAPSIQ